MQGNMERFRVYVQPPVSWAILAGIAALFICQGVPVRSGDATFPKAMDNVTVRQGENAILRCMIDHMVKRVAWLNRSQILYTGTDKWSIDNRVLLVANSNYEFSIQIQNVDVYDEGPYTCSVQTDNNPKMSRVHLIVQVPPRIIEISSNIAVNEGSNISLTCVATGRPEPTVNWKQVSPKVQGFVSEDEYMEISGITREQSGLYECTASNEVAAAVVRTVKVTVNYPPYISGAKNTGVPLGQKGVLQCEASAVPHANFSWYKEDKRLTGAEKGVRVENRETFSRLTFYNVTEHDFGNYTCVAINQLGNANTSVILYEISSPTTTSAVLPPEETTAALTPLKGPGAVHHGKNNAPGMTSCTWIMLPFLFLMHVKFLF